MVRMTGEVDGIPEGVQDAAIHVGANGLFKLPVEPFRIGALQVADQAHPDGSQYFRESRPYSRDGLKLFRSLFHFFSFS